jgi:uroporphyrinogen-III synthase
VIGVLITRPRDTAAKLGAELATQGFIPVVDPLLEIVDVADAEIELDGVQALIFTSARAVRVAAKRMSARHIRTYAVGGATAQALRQAGFARIQDADGDWQDLAALIARGAKPRGGRLLHLAGEDIAGDLDGSLRRLGFETARQVLYKAVAARRLAPLTLAALRERQLSYVLLYSARTARTLVKLVEQAGLAENCKPLTALCMSAAVAAAASDLPWLAAKVANAPTGAALLALLPRPGTLAGPSGGHGGGKTGPGLGQATHEGPYRQGEDP